MKLKSKLSDELLNIQALQLVGKGPTKINFFDKSINELSIRRAMGFEEKASHSEINDIAQAFKTYCSFSPPDLVRILESVDEVFINRYTAGQVLALLGDPRIQLEHPTMIRIESYHGRLGLPDNEVDEVVEQYETYGVRREWIEKETPEYEVQIPAFKIGKYLVTNKEYHAFLIDAGHEEIPSSWSFGSYNPFFSNHPVYTVSDHSAMKYCEWLSEKTNRKFRLPTEAEWEYAACGKDRLEFPWGADFLPDYCNTVETGILQTTAIGTFSKGNSPFGCCDMAGNVEEYVADFYRNYSSIPIIKDDLYIKNGAYRVARGGSFTRFRDLARTRRRHGRYPSPIYVMGFRLVEDI